MKSNSNPTNFSNNNVQTEKEIRRYLRLTIKRKWLILISFLALFFLWTVYVITFQSHPKYTASALLTFEDPRNVSTFSEDKSSSNIGKAGLIKSTSLLTDVVKSLKLNISIITEKLGKNDVFQYLYIDEKSNPGTYKLVKHGKTYDLFFKNEGMKIKEKKLLSFYSQDTVNINQFTFVLQSDLPKTDIEFGISKFENSIENLRNRINFQLDRSKTLLTVYATFSSPQAAATVVNTLVDRYIKLLLNMQNFKTNEVIKIVENEMEFAKKDLEEANDKLKQFRENYSWVGLNPTTSAQISEITGFERNKSSIQQKIDELRELKTKLESASNIDEKSVITRELLTYLSSEGLTLVPAFENQYNELSSKRSSLLINYARTHPFVIQNEDEFLTVINKIKSATADHLMKLDSQVEKINQDIGVEKFKLKKLPAKEIELAELVRDKGVKNDFYANLLNQYNRLKIMSEVQVSDVSVIDPSTPPPIQSVLGNLIKKIVIGIFVALGLAFGLAFVMEYFNKTVEDAEELQNKLKMTIIGTIPFIENENEKSDDFQELKSKKDSRLITLDYSPTLESEAYRDLRTKILYMNQNKQNSSFLITSLRPGEGKSLTASNIAITFAQQKISTVLIDGDIRRGVLHNVFGNKKKPGLSDFIISKATISNDNINKLIQSTFVPNLFLITSGSPVPNPTELHGSERMRDFINALKSKFGMVIIDTPPFQGGSDSIILSNIVDSLIIIVRANFTNVEELGKKIGQYPFFHDKILGVILNMVKMDKKKEQYQYSYYHY